MARKGAREHALKDEAAGQAGWSSEVIDAALDAIITIDRSGRVMRFNPAAERMFGYSRAETIGATLAELVVPRDLRASHVASLGRIERGEQPRMLDRPVQLRGVRKSGEEFPVEVVVTRSSEDPLLFTGFVRDLSPLMEAQKRGTLVQTMLTTAEELAGMGSWQLDLRSGAATWSEGMYRIQGFEPGAVAPGLAMYPDLVHPGDRHRAVALLETVANNPEELVGDDVTTEFRVLRPDGAVGFIRVRGRIEVDDGGTPVSWVGMAQDITDQRVAERELYAHYALTQALRDWESFDEGVVGLLRRLGTALDFPLGSLWTLDSDERLICRSLWSAPGVDPGDFEAVTRGASVASGEGVPGRAWRSAEPIFVEDLSSDTGFKRPDAAAQRGLASSVAFPAVADGGPLAVLSFYSFDRRVGTERLVRTLVGIGRELGRFLERRRADLGTSDLTKRELEVLKLAAAGNSGPMIAERLVVGPSTVKTHFEHIYEKLGVSDRAAAVAHALRIGLIP